MIDEGIAIVGAGPTGLTLACLLALKGTPCRILDQEAGPTGLSRAIGVSARSLEIFHEIGIAADAVSQGVAMRTVTLCAGGGSLARVATAPSGETRYPFLLALPQSTTERLLEARLRELGGEVQRGTRVRGLTLERDAASMRVTRPDGEDVLRAGWVVGADGAHSVVRKEAGIAFAGQEQDVVFAIVDAALDGGPPPGEGQYHFSEDGLLVVIPLPGGKHRLAATLDSSEEEVTVNEAWFDELLKRRARGNRLRLRELHNAGWGSTKVRIHTRIAESFRIGRGVLVGDAAHIFSPVGGQGMNCGIQDAHNLAWKLALIDQGASEALADSYATERSAVASTIQRMTTAQTRLVTARSRLFVGLRNTAVKALGGVGALDRRMAPQLAQLDQRYRRSLATTPGRHSCAGRRIADGDLEGPDGPVTMHQLLRERPFLVLALSPSSDELPELIELELDLRTRFGALVLVRSLSRGAPAWDGMLCERDGQLDRQLQLSHSGLTIIRPDHHISYHGPMRTNRAFLVHLLERMIGSASTANRVTGGIS